MSEADGSLTGFYLEEASGALRAAAHQGRLEKRAHRPDTREDHRRNAELDLARSIALGGGLANLAAIALDQLVAVLGLEDARLSRFVADCAAPTLFGRSRGGYPAPSPGPIADRYEPAVLERLCEGPVQLGPDDRRGLSGLGFWGHDTDLLLVPLHGDGALLGAFGLTRRGSFAPVEVHFAVSLATLLASALGRDRVEEHRTLELRALQDQRLAAQAELERTRAQLLHAARLATIGELTASVVHELNQPLNVVGGYVEILREGSVSEEQRTRSLDVMARAVERMTSLTDNLRSFARASAPVVTVVDVGRTILLAKELTAGARKRAVSVTCDTGLQVLGDPGGLEQVLVNLLANALAAGGPGVVIAAFALGADRVAIEVRDRGPGVPVALREKIFEAFFTTRPAGQGTGLGLSISARIVHEHQGSIEVEDQPGGGAVFRVVLPRHAAAGAEITAR